MVAGATELLSRRGMHGTSLREVVRHTATPRGSISYHFPGGKAQLIEAAVQLAQQQVSAILADLLHRHGAVAGVRAAFALRGQSLLDSRFEEGCPVLVVAVERYTDDAREAPDAATQQQLLDAANQAFGVWQAMVAASLQAEGVDAARAQRLAALVLSSMEGAVALCRAALDLRALDDVAEEVALLLQSAIDGGKESSASV